jgi:superoxide dismutase
MIVYLLLIVLICSKAPLVGSVRAKHVLPDLPYDYNALEPIISAEIMQIHHQKHHATYVNNLNQMEEKSHEALSKGDLRTTIALQVNILNYGTLIFLIGNHKI